MNEIINPGDSTKFTRDYFDSILVEMRHIDGVLPSTKLELYGETFSTPVMLAALSHLQSCHPEGMVEAARGIKAAGAVMWAGMGDEAELEGITSTGARTIKITHCLKNNLAKSGVCIKTKNLAQITMVPARCGGTNGVRHEDKKKCLWGTLQTISRSRKKRERQTP
jgi:hypothetical protein